MSQPTDREARFAKWLTNVFKREDRATLAALRRGLGREPGENAGLIRYLPPGMISEGEEDHYLLVAALFAWHPTTRTEGLPSNLGASLALLVEEHRRATGEMPASVEARVEALLDSHPEDLPEHLRRVIGLLKTKEIPVDWAQLLHDIRRWSWESRAAQRDWARAFWRTGKAVS
jgi:CRISPR system Cascade subunit CasB